MPYPAKEVKALREQLKLTQEQFAKLVGVTPRSVKRWESEDGEQENIPGAAGDVIAALKHGLERDPEKVMSFILGAIAIGGLAYILVKLIESFLEGKK